MQVQVVRGPSHDCSGKSVPSLSFLLQCGGNHLASSFIEYIHSAILGNEGTHLAYSVLTRDEVSLVKATKWNSLNTDARSRSGIVRRMFLELWVFNQINIVQLFIPEEETKRAHLNETDHVSTIQETLHTDVSI